MVGNSLKVLLLDFGGSFTLLIPNGTVFADNTVTVEVQKRETTNGQPLTFMKFVFNNPTSELSAPVLQVRIEFYSSVLNLISFFRNVNKSNFEICYFLF